MIYADDVRPHECRRDDQQERDSDDPETGNQFKRLQRWIESEHIHNVTMAVMDRPHVFEIHALTELRLVFEEWDKLTKYPVSRVSGKNTMVHNVNRRLYGR